MVEYIRAVDCLFFHADGTDFRTATVIVSGELSQAFADHSDGDGLKVSALVAIQRDRVLPAPILNVGASFRSRGIVRDTSITPRAEKGATQT